MLNIRETLILFALLAHFSSELVEITNFKCLSLDRSFCVFEYCILKAVNRSFSYTSIKINVFKFPINSMSLNLTVFKKANGYHPFLYDLKVDACAFLRGKRNPVTTFFYEFIESISNINHTCPYNHDIVVNKLDTSLLNNRFTNILPFPEGEYAVRAIWNTDEIPRVEVTIYGRLGPDRKVFRKKSTKNSKYTKHFNEK